MSGGAIHASRFTIERRAIPDDEQRQLRQELKATASGSLLTLGFSTGCLVGALAATVLALKAPASNGTFVATAVVFVIGFVLSFPLSLRAASALVVRRARSRRFGRASASGSAEVFRLARERVFLIDDAGAHSGAILLRCVNAGSPHAWLYVAAGILDERLMVVEHDDDGGAPAREAPNRLRAVRSIHRLPAPDGGIIEIEEGDDDVEVELLDPAVVIEEGSSPEDESEAASDAWADPFEPPLGEDECFLIDAAALPTALRRRLEGR